MSRVRRAIAPWAASALVLSLAACGGGGGGGGGFPLSFGTPSSTSKPTDTTTPPTDTTTPPTDTTTPTTHKVTGSVTGLAGSGLVLQNGSDELAVSENGSITVALALPEGLSYNVTVKSQPANPAQLCTVNGGSGTVGKDDVVDVAVVCSTSSFNVSGSVTGLEGSGLVLQNNAGDNIPVAASGLVDFGEIASGANYAVTVKTQPSNPLQTCSVNNGTGTVSDVAISDVAVICSTNSYSVSGTVAGLQGTGLVLKNNGGDAITVNANGAFTFPAKVASNATYTVSAVAPATGTSQACTVTNATGTIVDSAVSNVVVNCAANSFKVKGTVSGLDGVGLKLLNNGVDELTIAANGTFSFATSVASGTGYAVTVKTQPTLVTQNCVVTNGAANIGSADVTDVNVACTSQKARYAYLTTGANKVVPYAIGVTGQLTLVAGSANTDNGPLSIAVDATGTHGYVSTFSGIDQYNVANTGAVSAMSPGKVNGNNVATVLALDSRGRYVFALNTFDGFPNGTLNAFPVGSSTGALGTVVKVSTGLAPLALAAEPSGRFVYVGNFGSFEGKQPDIGSRITAYKADTLTSIASVAGGDFVTALTADPTGTFVFALIGDIDFNSVTSVSSLANIASSSIQAFKIQANGSLKSVSTVGIGGKMATSLVAHPAGKFAYVAMTNGAVRRYSVDTGTGALAALGDTTALSGPVLRVSIDPSGKFLFAATATGVTTYSVGANGALTSVSTLATSAVTSMALGL
ncbi:beta-propeller fold lactonase family protein [Variovorax sp. dw_954]|uniref:beta-propeller fold lactonase family protein n=1 Tax=Variovorax sp. dw_954 TaxID=2720078 RepID=UPI001BD6CAB6|nr:beta-propeller fold lactonase family protein [Variovorax sp. dw_954]